MFIKVLFVEAKKKPNWRQNKWPLIGEWLDEL